jgi:pentapeptide MXKDX repeat protein
MLSEEHAGDRLPRKMRHAESRVGVRAGPNGIMAGDYMAGDNMASDDMASDDMASDNMASDNMASDNMEGESGWIP